MAKEKYTDEEILNLIQKMIDSNCFLANVLGEDDITMSGFYKRIERVPSLKEEYVRACNCVVEYHVQQLIDIADNDLDPQRARNRIDVRKWIASKLLSDQYGDKLELNVNKVVDIRGALDEAKNRIREIIEIPKLHLVENTTPITETATGYKPAAGEKEGAETGSTAKNELDELLD